jgi:hypothetical protein
VPLLIGSRVLGLLVVEDQIKSAFGPAETIYPVAAPVAVAVDNACCKPSPRQARGLKRHGWRWSTRLSVALLGSARAGGHPSAHARHAAIRLPGGRAAALPVAGAGRRAPTGQPPRNHAAPAALLALLARARSP